MKLYILLSIISFSNLYSDCEQPRHSSPVDFLEGLGSAITEHSCALSPFCMGSGRDMLRAQMSVDGDLMLDGITRGQFGQITPQSIAIVDTGFDSSVVSSLARVPNFVTPSWATHSNPARDPNGHGTAVASLITGRDGVGLAPNHNLSIYQMEERGGDNRSYIRDGERMVVDACLNGNKIINYSQSERSANRDIPMFSQASKELLLEHGCLVVMASGNQGGRRDIAGNTQTDSILTVEATLSDGTLTTFSDHGEVGAFGRGVYTFFGQAMQDMQTNKCDGHSGRLIDGTSFSTPMIASIATQVRSILTQDSFFTQLPGSDQVALINNILSGSKSGRNINGLRAAGIAHSWVIARSQRSERDKRVSRRGEYRDDLPRYNPNQLLALLSSHEDPICQTNPNCESMRANCEQEKICLNNMRKFIALCSHHQTQMQNSLSYLTSRVSSLGHYDLASNYFYQSLELAANKELFLQNYFGRSNISSWERQMAALSLYRLGRPVPGVNDVMIEALGSPSEELAMDAWRAISSNQTFFAPPYLDRLVALSYGSTNLNDAVFRSLERRFRKASGNETLNSSNDVVLKNMAKSSDPNVVAGALSLLLSVRKDAPYLNEIVRETMRSSDPKVISVTRNIILTNNYKGSKEIDYILAQTNSVNSYERTMIYDLAMSATLSSAQRSNLARRLRQDAPNMSSYSRSILRARLAQNPELRNYLRDIQI